MSDLFFECHSGISGDMILGALADLGADLDAVAAGLASLPVSGFRLRREAVKQHGIAGSRAIIEVDEARDIHRSWGEVRAIVQGAQFAKRVTRRALTAFEKIARAEAKIHNVDIDKIHFHEVGCLDAIVDVCGAMLALELLGAERIRATALNVGHGTVRCRHGFLPVPAPATVEILKGAPCYQDDLSGELVTPTGAAILTTIAEGFGPLPEFAVERVGYGAGTRVHESRPNYLRVCAGRFADARNTGDGGHECPPSVASVAALQALEHSRLLLVTAEMDDVSGEVFTALFDRLFELGARDVNLTAIQMKKNRPGVSLQVLTDCERLAAIVEAVLRESTTFGVKVIEAERYCLPRRIEAVETPYGSIDVKVGEWDGRVVKVKAEFETCRRRANETGASLADVYRGANEAIGRKYFGD